MAGLGRNCGERKAGMGHRVLWCCGFVAGPGLGALAWATCAHGLLGELLRGAVLLASLTSEETVRLVTGLWGG